MGLLDVVDEDDNVIGREDYDKIHSEGLRHRTVQIFVFQYPDYNVRNKLLVAQRSKKQKSNPLKFHHSAGGHVRLGQTYKEAAIEEVREELFHDRKRLPEGFVFKEIAQYKNEPRPTDKEHTKLFVTSYPGPFSPCPDEIERVFWQDLDELRIDMSKSPEEFTPTFRNALSVYVTKLSQKQLNKQSHVKK